MCCVAASPPLERPPCACPDYFLPVAKETPADAQIVSHKLMLRAGLIRQTAAGIYAWLPLGHRVLKKIEQIVREEQDKAGAVEMLMPTIQSADLWRQSGRYDAYGPEMLRFKDRHDREMLYGPTNEEMITQIFLGAVKSYRDLPRTLYHIQWKFRDEVRPRFGIMRGREFLMKDAYSFDLDEAGLKASYEAMFVAYLRTFARLGLQAVPVRAPTGPIGGDLSHEFHILAPTPARARSSTTPRSRTSRREELLDRRRRDHRPARPASTRWRRRSMPRSRTARCRPSACAAAAASRSATSSPSATKYQRVDGPCTSRPPTAARSTRRWAATASASRG